MPYLETIKDFHKLKSNDDTLKFLYSYLPTCCIQTTPRKLRKIIAILSEYCSDKLDYDETWIEEFTEGLREILNRAESLSNFNETPG